MLCGCGQTGTADNAGSTETADISVETDTLTDIRKTASETEKTQNVTEEKPEDTAAVQTASPDYGEITEEDRELADKLREGQMLVIYPDGRADASDSAEEKLSSISFLEYFLSDETVDMMIEEGEYSSREEYLEYLKEYFPEIEDMTDSEGNITSKIEPAVYITVPEGYFRGDEESENEENDYEAYCRVIQWVLGRMRDDSVTAQAFFKTVEEKGYCLAETYYTYDEDGIITVSLGGYNDREQGVQITEKFHISGKPGVMIGEHFVFADTKKLAVTSRDEMIFRMLAGDFTPEDCPLICVEDDYYSSNEPVDMAEIAEKLPGLEELYMYQAEVVNIDSLSELTELTALSYYPLEETALPFTGLENLKTLRIYGSYEDYSFLNEMTGLTDIYVDFTYGERGLSPILDCKGITSLNIDGWGSDEVDCTGIYSLTNLRELEITGSDIDFAPISMLPCLEDLHVRCTSGEENVSELKNAPKLKKLFLSDLEIYDWSFLKEMSLLENLSLYYTPYVSNSDIKPLKDLKELSLCEAGCDSLAVEGLERLERFSYSLYSGYQDYSALESCKSLRELYIMGSGGALDCGSLTGLTLEIINCDGTDVKNAESLAEIKTLKRIYIAAYDSPDCGDMLREALPECDVNVEGEVFFHTAG